MIEIVFSEGSIFWRLILTLPKKIFNEISQIKKTLKYLLKIFLYLIRSLQPEADESHGRRAEELEAVIA